MKGCRHSNVSFCSVQEPHNAHRGFAWFVVWSLIAQVAMGFYLKLHLEKGIHGRIRVLFVTAHKWLGILVPVIGYTQIVLVSDVSLLYKLLQSMIDHWETGCNCHCRLLLWW